MTTNEFISVVGALSGLIAVGGSVWLGVFTVRRNHQASERAEARAVLTEAASGLAVATVSVGDIVASSNNADPIDAPGAIPKFASRCRAWHETAEPRVEPLRMQAEAVGLMFGPEDDVSQAYLAGALCYQVMTLAAQAAYRAPLADPVDTALIEEARQELLENGKLMHDLLKEARESAAHLRVRVADETRLRKHFSRARSWLRPSSAFSGTDG